MCRGLAVPDEKRAPWTFQRQWWPAEEEQGINSIDYLFCFLNRLFKYFWLKLSTLKKCG